MRSFRLTTVLWAFALLAAAMATFGAWGILATVFVLVFWLTLVPRKKYVFGELLFFGSVVGMIAGLVLPAMRTPPDATRQALCAQTLLNVTVDLVIDALEQHGLAAERNTGVGKPAAGFGHLRRDLVGVREVQAHPERVVAAQHLRERWGDAHRLHHRLLRADADELEVWDRARFDEYERTQGDALPTLFEKLSALGV